MNRDINVVIGRILEAIPHERTTRPLRENLRILLGRPVERTGPWTPPELRVGRWEALREILYEFSQEYPGEWPPWIGRLRLILIGEDVLSKLLPCPFCGGDDIRVLPQADGWKSVDCRTCGAMKRVVTDLDEQVVASWNQRS